MFKPPYEIEVIDANDLEIGPYEIWQVLDSKADVICDCFTMQAANLVCAALNSYQVK